MTLAYILLFAFTASLALGSTYPTVLLSPPGIRLDDLPGRSILNPAEEVRSIELVLTPVTVRSLLSNGTLLYELNAPGYAQRLQQSTFAFGPTLRVPAGAEFWIVLTNNLTNVGPGTPGVQFNISYTNLHTHGLHSSPGQLDQDPNVTYTGGDNIYLKVAPGETVNMSHSIDADHLPGLHWYHPHKHGSTSVQVSLSNGLIIVEDDPKWLPDANGCTSVKNALKSAKEVIIHISLLSLSPPNVLFPQEDPNYQILSAAGNSNLCCGQNGTNGALGIGSNLDIAFINGALQPIIPIQSGKWQRWRLVHTGIKRYFDIQIIDPETNAPTKDCEIKLIAKDGVYPLRIPRHIDHLVIPAGGRSEVLVRCSGRSGKDYQLSSGHLPSPMGAVPDFVLIQSHNQTNLATIQIESDSGDADADLVDEECTPLRPDYAADLRNVPESALLFDPNATFVISYPGCTIGPENFSYPDPNPLVMPLGKVVEWQIQALSFHPMHIHQQPFQLQGWRNDESYPNTTTTNYFLPGDFHDTFLLPTIAPVDASNTPIYFAIRSQPIKYGGYGIAHCHFQSHSDAGCAKVIKISCVPGDRQPEDCTGLYSVAVPGTYKSDSPSLPPTPIPSAGAHEHAALSILLVLLIVLM